MSVTLSKVKNRTGHKNNLKKLLKDRKKKARLYLLIVGVFLVGLGIILSPAQKVAPSVSFSQDKSVNSFSEEPVKIDKTLTGKITDKKNIKVPPVRILIPDLKIDLPVKEAKVTKGYWEVFTDSAGFGLGSAYPEDSSGNQVIFAHARQGLFLPLREAKIGQSIIIFTKDKWYGYKIKYIKEVSPNQTDVIAPTKDPILTLYTCSGFSDAKRLIISAEKI